MPIITKTISGSDCSDSANVKMLRNIGAKIYIGQDGKNLLNSDGTPSCDAVVYSTAIPKTNPEMVKANELKVPVACMNSVYSTFRCNKEYFFNLVNFFSMTNFNSFDS